MGFEEMGDDELVRWLGSWVGNISGTVVFPVAGGQESAGKITVSVHGDLVRLELTEAALLMPPDRLSQTIQHGYVDSYREALRQVGLVFDRMEKDLQSKPILLGRIRRLREEHAGGDGLRRMLRRQQAPEQESFWDPAADPLRRRI
ncbi:hypothetical protein [Mycobacterium sp. NPDC050853]|uniref:hypothetical protein n=1 Tax=Mycobacterium sp. NPDC050853 TaxID=3155160 RepID=UPI0033DA1C6B